MAIQNYEDLVVWQKSINLVVLVYEFTEDFPKAELFGLVMQMRRCVVSVPSNIAEGWARRHRKEFANSLSIATGSAAELDTQLILSKKLDYGKQSLRDECFQLLTEVQKMLAKMNNTLKTPKY